MATMTVLLVDDDVAQAALVRELLADAVAPGFTVTHVARLDAALGRARAGGIDVILLDLSLPDEQGLTGVKRLRATAPRTPIVVMSGGADESLAIKAVREGARNYLVKGRLDGGLVAHTLRDAIERQRVDDDLAHLAYHDPLTKLPNRALFTDRLAYALAQAGRYGQRVAVLFLDLDGFKEINDALGHEAGDELLHAVARRLARCVRESDTVARLAGDEFAVILPDVGTPADATVVVRKIVAAVGARMTVSGRDTAVTASIGISLYPADGRDAATLIRAADDALSQAKRAGKNSYRSASQPEDEDGPADNVLPLPTRRID